jgi:hypothetical protein
MNKRRQKLFLLGIAVVAVLVVCVAFCWPGAPSPPPVPTYRFLNGQEPTRRNVRQSKAYDGTTITITSFLSYFDLEADFNAIADEAATELIALGFAQEVCTRPELNSAGLCWFSHETTDERIEVAILDERPGVEYGGFRRAIRPKPDLGKIPITVEVSVERARRGFRDRLGDLSRRLKKLWP